MDLSNLRSNFDNCVIYNAIVKNDNPYDDWEVDYLIGFSKNGLDSVVEEYYHRGEKIINKMRELGVDTEENWIEIDETFVDPMVEIIEADQELVEVYRKIQQMLTALEVKYEVS